ATVATAEIVANYGPDPYPYGVEEPRHDRRVLPLRPRPGRDAAAHDGGGAVSARDGAGVADWTRQRRPDQSGLAPDSLITFAHFSVSSIISFSKSAGDPANVVAPRSASRCLNFGSARTALISELSLLTISPGVFLGAARPYHWLAS